MSIGKYRTWFDFFLDAYYSISPMIVFLLFAAYQGFYLAILASIFWAVIFNRAVMWFVQVRYVWSRR